MRTLLIMAAALFSQLPVVLTGHTREVWSLAVSPDGKLLASGSTDNTIKLWDSSSRQCVATIEADGISEGLAFSADGLTLASADIYKKVKLWDVASRKESKALTGMDGPVHAVGFSRDGKTLFAAVHDNYVRAWNLAKGGEPTKLSHDGEVVALSISLDGKWLASADGYGNVKVWDAATLKPVQTLKHGDKGTSVTFSKDGKLLATGGGDAVKLWDTSTWAKKASSKAEANALAFTPDGATLVVGTQDNLVLFLNGSSLAGKAKHEKHERPVMSVVVSPDGKTAYSASQDYSIRAWSIE